MNLVAAGGTRFVLRALYDSSSNSPRVEGFPRRPRSRGDGDALLLVRTLFDPTCLLAIALALVDRVAAEARRASGCACARRARTRRRRAGGGGRAARAAGGGDARGGDLRARRGRARVRPAPVSVGDERRARVHRARGGDRLGVAAAAARWRRAWRSRRSTRAQIAAQDRAGALRDSCRCCRTWRRWWCWRGSRRGGGEGGGAPAGLGSG